MGIISIATAADATSIPEQQHLKRITHRKSVKDLTKDKGVPIVSYSGPSIVDLPKFRFAPLQELQLPCTAPQGLSSDMLWQISWNFHLAHVHWSGFMSLIDKTEKPRKQITYFQQLIDLNPSDETCIYSTLLYIEDQAKKLNIEVPSVTFDQPLWLKAITIIEAKKKNIVCRLGGFHTMMSYLGSLGKMMEGSGIKEAFATIYAEKVVPHCMSGKAVSRAVRGHFTIDAVSWSLLTTNLFSDDPGIIMKISVSEKESLELLLKKVYDGICTSEEIESDEILLRITEEVNNLKVFYLKDQELDSLRCHLQVIAWKLLDTSAFSPTDWGWKRRNEMLVPISSDKAAAPESLMKFIRCKCKLTSKYPCSTQHCSCKRNGLACVTSCGDCRGESCMNKKFKDNCPSAYWARKFVERHGLTQRFADNLKPSRAQISTEDVHKYFSHLEDEIKDVLPCNIFNFDETNFTNDPKRKKVIARRGLRRVEMITDHSKQSFSVMFCGNASSLFLPPMVIYKAKNVYENWTTDGPAGAIYGSTPSGWFDMETFQRWFEKVLLPHVSELPGKKVIIGDNLGCHFNEQVILACREHNISFICLIPNSTHLTQPLDVAVFKPLKAIWFEVVAAWRKTSRLTGAIPKECFPVLLSKVISAVKKNDGKNLVSGFRTCGIVPLCSQEVLKKLPSCNKDCGGTDQKVWAEICLSYLEERFPKVKPRENSKRGRKVEPGKNVANNIPAPERNNERPGCSKTTEEVIWTCGLCQEQWAEDDNRWLLCDCCDQPYHLQCSGVQYETVEYYDVDIQTMEFHCANCQ